MQDQSTGKNSKQVVYSQDHFLEIRAGFYETTNSESLILCEVLILFFYTLCSFYQGKRPYNLTYYYKITI